MEDILTAEQVAQILQVHPFTVLKFIKQGKLKASKLGRVYRIRKSDVDSFLDNQVERAEKTSEKTATKKKKEPVKEEKATSSAKKRIEGQGKTESFSGKSKAEEIQQITEIPETNEVTEITEIPERNESVDRHDIDHYVLELKAN